MAPRATKRKSDETPDNVEDEHNMEPQTVAIKTGSPSGQASPRKKQRTGISLSQKQALIDNLQLEITERARKLRAQYNLQAQGLRTRIEIRVNRIPMALRKARMGELADKYRNGQHPQQVKPTPARSVLHSAKPPPSVPGKDTPLVRTESSTSTKSHATTSSRPGPGRPPKRARFGTSAPCSSRALTDNNSTEMLGASRENGDEPTESMSPRKKLRADVESDTGSKVLSPASGNVRLPRPTPGGKPPSVRPAHATENTPGPSKSPAKHRSVSNLFGSWAEKARSPKRKESATTLSSAIGSTRGRKPVTTSATGATKASAAATTTRRFSDISESSESSTSTAAKKDAVKKTSPAKKVGGVMGSIRRGVAGAAAKKAAEKKAAVTQATEKKATPASTATGRVLRLRKRNA